MLIVTNFIWRSPSWAETEPSACCRGPLLSSGIKPLAAVEATSSPAELRARAEAATLPGLAATENIEAGGLADEGVDAELALRGVSPEDPAREDIAHCVVVTATVFDLIDQLESVGQTLDHGHGFPLAARLFNAEPGGDPVRHGLIKI